MLAAGTLLVGGDMLVPACVHDDSTLFIRDVLAPPTVAAGQQCIFTADPTQPTITSGSLDVALRTVYQAELLVGNQAIPLGDPNKPVTETARIRIEGGIVRITDVNTKTLFSYTTNTSGTVDPQSGTSPGFASINLQVLDSATVQGVAPTSLGSTVRLISNIRIFGHTLGGQYVESDEFPFPVDICFGCLIAFPASGSCLGAMASTGMTSSLPVPCFAGQDQPVDCALCQSIPACQGTAPAAVVTLDAGPG
jgi:hypothetical protein